MLALVGYISGVLSFLCYVPYIRDIFKGTTKPERASWFIWSVLSSIQFFAQISKGATNSLWLIGVQAVGVVVIFALSIRYGKGGLMRRDIVALIAAAFGLLAWYLTQDATWALVITVVIDLIGGSLTVVKAYEDPGSETMSTWFLSSLAGIFATIAVGSLNWVLLLFPVYVIVINFAVVVAMQLGKTRKHRSA
jgi:hypothetical protein